MRVGSGLVVAALRLMKAIPPAASNASSAVERRVMMRVRWGFMAVFFAF